MRALLSGTTLVGPRRALTLLVLGFLTTIFVLVGLAQGGAWARCFFALAAAYGTAFFALAAEWFWARWFTMGLASSGITMAALGLVTGGWNASIAVWGAMHLLIYLPLVGERMAARYEDQEAWRRRYSLDDYGVVRIKRAVKGAATALPTLIFFTLAPRDGSGLALAALPALVVLGLVGVVRLRFWGVALLGVAAVGAAAAALLEAQQTVPLLEGQVGLWSVGALAALFLSTAVAPFVVPAWRFLRQG